MRNWYKKLSIAIISILLLITAVNAAGTTVILDTTDKSMEMSGEVLILLSLGVAIFAMLIIIKIFMMSKRSGE
jgi:hypothetical protein